MHLPPDELALFFKIMFNMLWGINEKRKIVPRYPKPESPKNSGTSFHDAVTLTQAMWEDPSTIDEYLAESDDPDLTEEKRTIIGEWRRHHLKGQFWVSRHLAKYSVLMTAGEPSKLYGVVGLTESLEEMSPIPTPFLTETVLLPFCGKIVYDGILNFHNIRVGPGIRASINRVYSEAKAQDGIIVRLIGEETEAPQKKPTKAPAKPRKSAKSLKPLNEKQAPPKHLKVPESMARRYGEIAELISEFCAANLDKETEGVCLKALAKLCRKRPSPLERGKAPTWACGLIHAIATINFLFDQKAAPHIDAPQLAQWFGLAKSTSSSKGAEIRAILDLSCLSHEFQRKDRQIDIFSTPLLLL
ncbi:MAG: DUF6398 domain-containing protein [Deltaproteobacteria bacterium]|nr:DUF6398 domain-containing protein [Deltaproteobacteria bacterium]